MATLVDREALIVLSMVLATRHFWATRCLFLLSLVMQKCGSALTLHPWGEAVFQRKIMSSLSKRLFFAHVNLDPSKPGSSSRQSSMASAKSTISPCLLVSLPTLSSRCRIVLKSHPINHDNPSTLLASSRILSHRAYLSTLVHLHYGDEHRLRHSRVSELSMQNLIRVVFNIKGGPCFCEDPDFPTCVPLNASPSALV